MAFSDWLIIGGAALLIKHGLKKSNSEEEYGEWFDESIREDHKRREEEWNRRLNINENRRDTPCKFKDGLSYSEFQSIAKSAEDRFRRIKKVNIDGPVIRCEVESQTGYSSWNFSIDFNNWGHITGTYWTQTENYDSNIPEHYGNVVSGIINDYLHRNGIVQMDYSGIVDSDPDIGTERALRGSKGFFSRIFGINNTINMHYDVSDLIGEHLYVVLSCLRRNGFQSFQVVPVKDVNGNQEHYVNEVKSISIQGNDLFRYGEPYPSNSKVVITFHEREEIRVPFSERSLKHQNCDTVRNRLWDYGFIWVEKVAIEEGVRGFLRKEGSVESVVIGTEKSSPLQANTPYPYDERIVISYYSHESNPLHNAYKRVRYYWS